MDNKKASAAVIIFDFIIMIVQLLKLPLDRIDYILLSIKRGQNNKGKSIFHWYFNSKVSFNEEKNMDILQLKNNSDRY